MTGPRKRRIGLAVLLGTLTLFVWGALSHMLIIRGVGFAPVPDEASLTALLHDVPAGLYAFPAPPDWVGEPLTEQSNAAWVDAFEEGPSGMLIVRPQGEGPFSLRKLSVQLIADAFAVALAVWVVAATSGSLWRRAASVACFGAVAVLTVGAISWNWYAFTDAFFVAQGFDMIGGWVLVGLVVSAIIRPAPRR